MAQPDSFLKAYARLRRLSSGVVASLALFTVLGSWLCQPCPAASASPVSVSGALGITPLQANLQLTIETIPIVPVQPYFEDSVASRITPRTW